MLKTMFDGDEFNLHIPQDEMAVAETMIILNTKACIMGETRNATEAHIVYDALTGVYMLTNVKKYEVDTVDPLTGEIVTSIAEREIMVPFSNYMEYSLLIENPDFDYAELLQRGFKYGSTIDFRYIEIYVDTYGRLQQRPIDLSKNLSTEEINEMKKKCLTRLVDNTSMEPGIHAIVHAVSGKLLFSAFLPKSFELSSGKIIIHNGILLRGAINKAAVGGSQNTIIQYIFQYYTQERAATFISDLYLVIDKWLLTHGLTVRLSDCASDDPKIREIVSEEVAKARLTVAAIQATDPSKLTEVQRNRQEQDIMGAADIVKKVGARVTNEAFNEDNNIRVMSEAGSKGNASNVGQMSSAVGQQFKDGGRLPMTMTGGTRVMPSTDRNDLDLGARGFIDRSFYQGLTPSQFFALQIASRQSLIESTVSVGASGALMRRMARMLEDLRVEYDGSVRNHDGMIIEQVAGADGFDPRETQFVQTKKGQILSFVDVKFLMGKIRNEEGLE